MLGLGSILKLVHSVAIVYITFLLYEINKTVPALYIGIQILLTIVGTVIQRKSLKSNWSQIFLSLSLVYALRPTELNVLRYLFLFKIFYVQKSLSDVSENLFTGSLKIFRLSKIIFDFARLTFIFYMVLGIFIVAYKYWAYLWTDPQKTLSTHQILYFFMITSSSIGYGDVTPKNQYQMYFLIAFIPILIISFGQYFGQAVGYFDEFIRIIQQNASSIVKNSILSQGIWGAQQCKNLTDYINSTQSQNQTIYQQKQTLANNWISLAFKNYETHQPLLMQILDSQDSREYKMLVASKLKKHFYPNNWVILEKGNLDKHIFMIQEGEVQVNGEVLGKGRTFNLNGFSKEEVSTQTYKTRCLTSVWAISVVDLVEIGRNSVNLENKIHKKLKQTQGQF